MKMLFVALLSALLAAGAAYAADGDTSDRSDVRNEQKKSERPAQKAPAKKDDIDVCKEQAHGKSGPERGSFMTKCLRQN